MKITLKLGTYLVALAIPAIIQAQSTCTDSSREMQNPLILSIQCGHSSYTTWDFSNFEHLNTYGTNEAQCKSACAAVVVLEINTALNNFTCGACANGCKPYVDMQNNSYSIQYTRMDCGLEGCYCDCKGSGSFGVTQGCKACL